MARRNTGMSREDMARTYDHQRTPADALREEKARIVAEEAAQGFSLTQDWMRPDGMIRLAFTHRETGVTRERFMSLPVGSDRRGLSERTIL